MKQFTRAHVNRIIQMLAQDRIESAVADASPSLSRVGRWMSTHPIRTLSHSAEEIAGLTGTSVAAINRFARAAGFEGFTHLKAVLGEELHSTVEPLRKLGRAKASTRSRMPKARTGKGATDSAAFDG